MITNLPAILRGRAIKENVKMSDLIDRQALLRQIDIDSDGEPGYYGDTWKFIDTIKRMPSALGTNLAEVGTKIEPLTDKEQRIFLAAMRRERKVCTYAHEPCEVPLTKVCDEIVRKVKGALWI